MTDHSTAYHLAVIQNDTTFLELLVNRGIPVPDNILCEGAAYLDEPTFKYLYQNGAIICGKTIRNLMKNKKSSIMAFVKKEKINTELLNVETFFDCDTTSEIDDLLTIGCVWGPELSSYFVQQGKLSLLQYIHENGCPWNEESYLSAFLTDNTDCLNYLYTNNCPTPTNIYSVAYSYKSYKCIKYLFEHDVPDI